MSQQHASQAEHLPEGRSTAAWTGAFIVLASFAVGALGLVLAQPWMFILAVVGVIGGGVAGRLMTQLGYGVGGPNNRGKDR
jgi:purine-cytosine permease-like protein